MGPIKPGLVAVNLLRLDWILKKISEFWWISLKIPFEWWEGDGCVWRCVFLVFVRSMIHQPILPGINLKFCNLNTEHPALADWSRLSEMRGQNNNGQSEGADNSRGNYLYCSHSTLDHPPQHWGGLTSTQVSSDKPSFCVQKYSSNDPPLSDWAIIELTLE